LCAIVARAAEPILIPTKIDGPMHDPANHTYWFGPFSECCSVADFNADGRLDIAAGRNWYEAPDWKKHENFRDGAETNGPETDDNSEFAMDVNRDGLRDIVSSGWMHMKGVFWYENPGKPGVKWKAHRIHSAKSMEGVIHGDMDGDGDDDLLCNHWNPVENQGMTWLEHIDRAPWFVEHIIGADGEYHGNGLGDINGDGRVDIVTPTGWYEAPPDSRNGRWVFHPDYTLYPLDDPAGRTSASHPMLVHDCNGDGKNDILVGIAHHYGLVWLEQIVDAAGKRSFKQHWIEKDFGQCHTLALGDINGDDKLDFVTGKRLFAHHGRDVSCYDPLFGFWYEMAGGQFTRHILYYNHLPWYPGEKNINPPPNGAISMGMKVYIVDLDKDGRNDIVLSGKTGLYVFYNVADTPRPKPQTRLPQETKYPSWVPWNTLPSPEAPPIPRKIHDGVTLPQAGMPAIEQLKSRGFSPLFNGRDLAGWKVPEGDNGHWKVVDGVIDYDACSESKGDKNLYTDETFEDYEVYFEWRFKRTSGLYPMPTILPDGSLKTDQQGNVITVPTPNADSGLLFRPGHQANLWCWPCGSGELWMVRNNKDATPQQRAAAVPKLKADKPVGEWNAMMAKVVGDRVTITLNGATVIENAQVPGVKTSGPIGLQHHGGKNPKTGEMSPASSLVQFRNIYVKRLKGGEANWVTLFGGRNLDAWQMGSDKSWGVEDGVIALKRADYDGKEHNNDYLWTKEPYGDFTLELEFKTLEKANSGVFLRTSNLKDPVYTGIEVQVNNSFGKPDLSRGGTVGAIYDCQAPTKNAAKPPGEWQRMRLTCKGPKIVVELNGETVNEMNLNQWTEPNKNPDGSKNKFPKPLKEFARKGHVGLQDHGRPVWYRNIKIKKLD
jgi:hypothetical protein